eukprot:2587412-Heterocapsa_arctica.AAC.1
MTELTVDRVSTLSGMRHPPLYVAALALARQWSGRSWSITLISFSARARSPQRLCQRRRER